MRSRILAKRIVNVIFMLLVCRLHCTVSREFNFELRSLGYSFCQQCGRNGSAPACAHDCYDTECCIHAACADDGGCECCEKYCSPQCPKSTPCYSWTYYNSSFSSANVVGFSLQSSADDCCRSCANADPPCHYWNFVTTSGTCTLMASSTSRVNEAGTVAGSARDPPPLPQGWLQPECPGFGRCGLSREACLAKPQCYPSACKDAGYACAERPTPKHPCGDVACGAYIDERGKRTFDVPWPSGGACYHTSPYSNVLFCAAAVGYQERSDHQADTNTVSCPVSMGIAYQPCQQELPPKTPPSLPLWQRCSKNFCECCKAKDAFGSAGTYGGGQYNASTCGWSCASSASTEPDWCFAEPNAEECGVLSAFDFKQPGFDPCRSPLCGFSLGPYPPAEFTHAFV